MSQENTSFTQKLYGQGQFRYSVDNPELPAGFIRYHKANFARHFGLSEAEFAGRTVLDTGAGPCKHAMVLALMGAQVTATDLTPANLEKGEVLKAFYQTPNIGFRLHDMMRPVDFGVPYDLASAHNWMQHAENPSVVFRNLAAAIRPGGRIYLSLYHGGTFRFFIAQIARSLLEKQHYEPMRDLVRYAFPAGFQEFGNAVDIYMENIFDDFFVPYCHTTTYEVVLHDAALLGLRPVGEASAAQDLSGLDNIPLRIGLEKVGEPAADLSGLAYTRPVDEFAADNPLLQRSAQMAREVAAALQARGQAASTCAFCLGLYRLRAQYNASTDAQLKHEALQRYLETCLDDGLRNISYFYDSARLHGQS